MSSLDSSLPPSPTTAGGSDGAGQPGGRTTAAHEPPETLLRIEHELALALACTTDLTSGLVLCLDAALAVSGMDSGGIYLRDEDTGRLKLAVHRGLSADYVTEVTEYDQTTPQARMVEAGQTVYVQFDSLACTQGEASAREGLRALGVVPLRAPGQVIGCLNVASHREDAISATARLALETLAAGAALSVGRLQAHLRLAEERTRLNDIIEGTRAGTWEWNVQTGETVFNEAWAAMLGYTLAELSPTTFGTWERFAHPDDVVRSGEQIARHFAGETSYYENVCRMRHRSGRWIWVLDRGRLTSRSPDGRPLRMVGAHTDISAQKNAEVELRSSEERLRLALEAAQMGVYVWDIVSGQVQGNRRNEEQLGYAPGEHDGTLAAFANRVHPADRAAMEQMLDGSLKSAAPFSHEFRVLWPDGSVRWLVTSGRVELDESGAPRRLYGVSHDVTERRKAADEIQRQADLIQTILDAIPDHIFYKDGAGVYRGCNPAFLELVGRSREEVVGRTDRDLFPAAVAERLAQRDRESMGQRRAQRGEEWFTYPGGRSALLETLTTPHRGPDGKVLGFLSISRDITVGHRDRLLQEARTRLLELAPTHALDELMVRTLDEAEVLTQSEIGFFHFLAADQCTLTLQAWSTRTTRLMCKADGKGRHYNVSAAGVWVDCVRERRAVIHNDYAALQHRRGLPPGHAAVLRELVVPVIRQGLIVCILGVGNKRDDYSEDDATYVSRLADFVWDIVERKRAEIALSDNAARLRLALVATNQGMFDRNLLTGAITVSPEYASMLGHDPVTFVETAETWRERLHPDDRDRALQALEDCVAGRATDYRVETRMRTGVGGWKWILSVGRLVEHSAAGRPGRMLGTHTDISEAKLAEEALRLSEERHRQLVETSADWIWETDRSGTYTYASPRVKDLLGYEPVEIVGRRLFDLMPPAEVARTGALMQRMIAAGESFVAFERASLHRDGRVIVVEVNGVPIHDQAGDLIGYRGMDRDLTARRMVERQLRLRDAALQAAANAVVITDRRGTIEWANAAFTALSGWQLSEAIGRNPRDLIRSGQHGPEFFRQLWETICSGRVWRGEIVNRRKDGVLRTEEMTITPLFDESGAITHYIAIKQDVTERKALEAHSRHSQRIEALGAMAGGIAHDLNNILTPIGMVTGLLRDRISGDRNRELLAMVEQSSRRGSKIVQQLLTFSRGAEGERMPLRLSPVLKEVMAIMRETFPREIHLDLEVQPGLPVILGDATQLHQVLINLCVNARDALPEGGHLTIVAGEAFIAPGDARLPAGITPGNFVVLQVKDTGQGIAPDQLPRIFDPFFTTKPVGKGTGLGLPTVQGIVKSHGGFLQVESTLGRGTTVSVYLPALGSESETESPPADASQLAGAGQLILLVDDERGIREAAREVLVSSGYRVRLAVHGEDALAQYRACREEVALIITDLMMPVMHGRALVAAVRELAPTLPIVVATGKREPGDQAQFDQLGLIEVLNKPYSYADLLGVVERALARR